MAKKERTGTEGLRTERIQLQIRSGDSVDGAVAGSCRFPYRRSGIG